MRAFAVDKVQHPFFVLDHLLYVSNMLNPDTTEVRKGELYDAVT